MAPLMIFSPLSPIGATEYQLRQPPGHRPPTQNSSENISLDWWSIPFYPQLQFIWPYSSILMTSILLTSILMTSTLMISILMTSIMITSILMPSILITSIQSLQFLSLQIWWLQFSWLQFLWLQFDDLMLMLFRQHQRLIWGSLLEVDFVVVWVGWGGMNSNNRVKPNSVELSWGCVEVELGLWQY